MSSYGLRVLGGRLAALDCAACAGSIFILYEHRLLVDYMYKIRVIK